MSYKTKMQHWPLYTLLGVLFIMFGLYGLYLYEEKKLAAQTDISPTAEDEAAEALASIVTGDGTKNQSDEKLISDTWESIYPNTKTMLIGSTTVNASIAASWPDRIKGLSNTPYLPEDVVKLFVFDSDGQHSIWMKEMNYEIDILWLDNTGRIVYLVEGASPDSYPAMFTPESDAKYVVETASGFVAKWGIKIGDETTLPDF